MIKAEIIKDSINGATSNRLTTFVVEFPRFINAEVLRHRALSFSSASSRAVPSKKLIQGLIDNPAMPVFWGKNQGGMQAYQEIDDVPSCKSSWLEARDECIQRVEGLVKNFDLHKQIANRILEPFQNITLIISGTEWENFFKLRASEFAQPEFKELAYLMLEKYNESIPNVVYPSSDFGCLTDFLAAQAECLDLEKFCEYLGWHIPYEDRMPDRITDFEKLKISIARCARVSYLNQDGEINKEKDFELYDRLTSSGHFSPCEHLAFPVSDGNHGFGNFNGWFQFRKLLPRENQSDDRVIRYQVVGGLLKQRLNYD